jgi:hypothetical protein
MTDTLPAISVVMPLYNKASYVLASISSVQTQSFANWEMVVVDDGSTDDSCKRVAELGDPRIRIIQQTNQGVSAARNAGILAAQSELIAFLDADDEWLPTYLDSLMALVVRYPAAGWYATSYEFNDPVVGRRKARLRGVRRDFENGILENYFEVATQSDPPVCSSAVAAKKSVLSAIGCFPVGIASGEDLLTWARLAIAYPLAYDCRPLAIFHVSGLERPPDPTEKVGLALTELAASNKAARGMSAYIGLWYRMQAVMAMRFGQRPIARRFAVKSVKSAPFYWRNNYVFILSLLPKALGDTVDKVLRTIASAYRSKTPNVS